VNALVLPEAEQNEHITIPGFASAEIDTKVCLPYSGPECGACESACPVKDALIFELEKPVIDLEHCVGCALCREACIVEDKAINIKPL
jgi:ferredoxin-type protein NapG